MASFLNWLDDRTGFRALIQAVLYEPIPGGARWRYVWGSTLVYTFLVQVITGLCLWTAYSPSVQNAWASIHYLEEFMPWGRWIRGIHHFTAQAMVVLLVLHLLQVILDGAYRAPREINYWLGWVLAFCVMGLALTGYLLPWDQKGYYATQVATKILGATPWVGPALQQLVQGGPNYGQLTLTRFFALHAGFLPATLMIVLVGHVYLFRRHGISARSNGSTPDGWFWPDQVWRDSVACLLISSVVVLLVVYRGAELSAPADPAEPFAAARPEWYFLSLFRVLKFEWVERLGLAFGAIVLPGIVMTAFLAMPLVAVLRGGHTWNRAIALLTICGVMFLTALAAFEDARDDEHQIALAEARRDARRARELAARPERVPPEGPLKLTRNDPGLRGPRIFAAHCASCHRWEGHDGRGRQVWQTNPETGDRVQALPTAPDLAGLGSREWMRGILTDFTNHFAALKNADWFGHKDGIDPDHSEMADWSGDLEALLSEENEADLAALIEFLVAETGRDPAQLNLDIVPRGRELALKGNWTHAIDVSCRDCHETIGKTFDPRGEGGSGYPDLAKYLSQDWLTNFLEDPGHPRHYGNRNRMPGYRERLTADEMKLLVQWLLAAGAELDDVRIDEIAGGVAP